MEVEHLGSFDVVAIGSGAAGLYAAVSAADHADRHLSIASFTRSGLTLGGSTRQSHAVDAVLDGGSGDSPEMHCQDTLRAGEYLNDEALVRTMTQDAPARVREVEAWGCVFERTLEGRYAANTYGGNRISRALRSPGLFGLEISRVLSEQVRKRPIRLFERMRLVDLCVEDNTLHGALFFHPTDRRMFHVTCGALVLACGGGANMYAPCSACRSKTCDGIAAAYRAGARLIDLEMVQFHATGIVSPGHASHGSLLPEEFRAQGGVLVNRLGEAFMARYHVAVTEATRDVISRAIWSEIEAGNGTSTGGVLLDVGDIGGENLERLLCRLPPDIAQLVRGVPRVEVSPTAHYLMGGIAINSNAEASIRGLYACGEDSGGVHGANRIGGNGRADALVFRYISGREVARHASSRAKSRPLRERISVSERISGHLPGMQLRRKAEVVSPRARLDELRRMIWTRCGIIRSQQALIELESTLDRGKQEADSSLGSLDEEIEGCFDYRNLLEVSLLICKASLVRNQNAGAFHKREASDGGAEDRRYSVSALGQSFSLVPRVPSISGRGTSM